MSKLTTFAKLAGLSAAVLLAGCESEKPMPMMASVPPPAPAPQPAPAMPPPPMARPTPPPVAMGPLPGSAEDFRVNVGDRVLFAYDKSDLDDRDRQTLQKQAAWLQRYPAVTLIVEGHCDERGTREYNIALGARRAQSAKDYLVSLGVSAARLDTISYGKERPVCVDSNEACWAQNRRGVSVIKSGAVS
jgi:peptidoglycan-associated lipoprotein